MTAFARKLRQFRETEREIHDELPHAGRKLLSWLLESLSLREVARRTGLSPTYLSRVKNGGVSISPEAYLRLERVRRR